MNGHSTDVKAGGGVGLLATLAWVSCFLCKLRVFVLGGHSGLLQFLHYLPHSSFPILYPVHAAIPNPGPVSTVLPRILRRGRPRHVSILTQMKLK